MLNEESKSNAHEMLSNRAYDLWKEEENKKLDYKTFLELVKDELGIIIFYAVITSDLKNEIENGGFYQWHDNKYSVVIEDLISFFKENFNKKDSYIKTMIIILEEINEEIYWYDNGLKLIRDSRYDYDYKDFFINALDDRLNQFFRSTTNRFLIVEKNVYLILEEFFKNEKDIREKIREENS
jgi:hypothetical protein